jgi:hypothetical protein
MPCRGDGSTGVVTTSWLFQNFAGTKRQLVPVVLNPTNVAQVVAGVQLAEGVGGFIKAIGSRWSYSDATVDETTLFAMDTDALSRVLNGPVSTPPTSVIPFALKASLPNQRLYVHVEAGIKIFQLNCKLDSMTQSSGMGLAMPTLGGNNGQSLAGAIATGTHGGDVDLSPISDAVRAIHLVGPGGQEWWIERPGEHSITDPILMAQAQAAGLLCSDLKMRYEENLFRAALVSLGRMGVIYSYVLEVVDAFKLTKKSTESTWSAELNRIASIQNNATVSDRFVEIILNPYPDANQDHYCIRTTCDTAGSVATDKFNTGTPDYCGNQAMAGVFAAQMAVLPEQIALAATTAVAGLSPLNLIPFVGPLLYSIAASQAITAATASLVALETALAEFLAAAADGDLGEPVANILNLAVAAGFKQLVPDLIPHIMRALRAPTPAGDPGELGPGYRILTSQPACPPPGSTALPQGTYNPTCERQIDGAEFTLDVSPGTSVLVGFVMDVFALTQKYYDANTPVGFAMSLRFQKKTMALLGMQQFPRNCSIEFTMLRGVAGQGAFYSELLGLARKYGAIQHWGQMNDQTSVDVATLYPALTSWRLALLEIINGGNGMVTTFQSRFSVTRQLEPPATHILPDSVLTFIQSRLALGKLLRRSQPR